MMTKMSKDPKIYSNLCDSIFPHVHGSEEIKKGLVLMLSGGVAKSTGEGFYILKNNLSLKLINVHNLAERLPLMWIFLNFDRPIKIKEL